MADVQLDPPPIQHQIADPKSNFLTPLPWALWFEKLTGFGSGVNAPSFGVVAVPDAENVVATIPTDTLTLNAGPGIALETNALGKSVLIRATGVAEPAPPNKSVQFNDEDVFGGNAAFLFDKTTISASLGLEHDFGTTGSSNLMVGTGHTIA